MNLSSHLQDELRSLGSAFRPNELTYLALTSKVETAVRDKLTAMLSRRLRSHLCVSREWPGRTDLAIYDCKSAKAHGRNCKPSLLLEAKAMYSYDAIPTRIESTSFERHFLPQLTADLEKARRLGSERSLVYGLLLVTHPTGSIPRHLSGIVKYSGMINTGHTQLGPEKFWKEMRAHIVPQLRALRSLVEGSWDASTAFDLACTVGYWLIRTSTRLNRGAPRVS